MGELVRVILVRGVLWVFGDIFRSKDLGEGSKTLWVILVIIIPRLGILVYLIARGHGMQDHHLGQAKEIQAGQAEYIKSVAPASSGGAAGQIADAQGPLDSGAITQAEFDQLKAGARCLIDVTRGETAPPTPFLTNDEFEPPGATDARGLLRPNEA